jgi:hypothetical protein
LNTKQAPEAYPRSIRLKAHQAYHSPWTILIILMRIITLSILTTIIITIDIVLITILVIVINSRKADNIGNNDHNRKHSRKT